MPISSALAAAALPGYGYLKVDTTTYTRFRAGYVSGAIPDDTEVEVDEAPVLRPLADYPAIPVEDEPGVETTEADALDADPRFRTLTGNIVFPGFTAPKLVWMARHEPALFDRVACVLLPKDYLRLWLTGDHTAEMSDAAGTSWLDTGARAWSDALLSASGMRRDQMPDLVEGNAPSGQLRAGLAQELGLPPGIVVAGGRAVVREGAQLALR